MEKHKAKKLADRLIGVICQVITDFPLTTGLILLFGACLFGGCTLRFFRELSDGSKWYDSENIKFDIELFRYCFGLIGVGAVTAGAIVACLDVLVSCIDGVMKIQKKISNPKEEKTKSLGLSPQSFKEIVVK